MTSKRGPGEFIKTVRIKGDRHNVTFPIDAMKVLRVGADDYVTFFVGDRPGEVVVKRTAARPASQPPGRSAAGPRPSRAPKR